MYAFRLNNFKPERVSCTPVKIIPRKIFIPCVDVYCITCTQIWCELRSGIKYFW